MQFETGWGGKPDPFGEFQHSRKLDSPDKTDFDPAGLACFQTDCSGIGLERSAAVWGPPGDRKDSIPGCSDGKQILTRRQAQARLRACRGEGDGLLRHLPDLVRGDSSPGLQLEAGPPGWAGSLIGKRYRADDLFAGSSIPARKNETQAE